MATTAKTERMFAGITAAVADVEPRSRLTVY